jgi:uncharacterized protein YjiS (DUF1127 family)
LFGQQVVNAICGRNQTFKYATRICMVPWPVWLRLRQRRRPMFEPITRRLYAWHMRNFTRRKLSMLDDRLLSDLGIERDHINEHVARIEIEGPGK